MYNFWERAGTLAIAGALLFVALRVHKSGSRHYRFTKPAGVILSFIAGLAFLVTFVGTWLGSFARATGAVGVAALIICVGIIAVDWLLDGRPDKPAFWAAFTLSLAIVVGVGQIPAVTAQVGNGGHQVTNQISRVGK